MKRLFLVYMILALVLGCAASEPSASEKERLILASTTSTQDSGLLDVLVPLFQKQTGYVVQTIAVGTGAALRMAEEGNADVLLVHAPSAEQALMEAGFGKDRFLVMHNDFVVVGPSEDPAGVRGGVDSAESFQKIATAQAPFVSRGDDSGTNKKELSIWQQTAANPNADKPTWYIESGQGMGRSLFIASEKSAYIMTDRATYLAQRDNLALDIVLEGDPVLLNIYHVITTNPDKWPDSNYDAALAFAKFLLQDDTQAVIESFGVTEYGQPLFFPDAGKTDSELGLR